MGQRDMGEEAPLRTVEQLVELGRARLFFIVLYGVPISDIGTPFFLFVIAEKN